MNFEFMIKHQKIIGVIYIFAFFILALVGGVLGTELVLSSGVWGVLIALVFVLINSFTLAAGVGLYKNYYWKHYVAFPVALLGLFNFPINTAISIYYFWYFFSYEYKR